MTEETGMENTPGAVLLGEARDYADTYSPQFLFPIARQKTRAHLAVDESQLPFRGHDLWSAYELSWLDSHGRPQVAMAEFAVPADSPNIIESKSFKYYLNSFNQSQFDSWKLVSDILTKDLSAAAGADIETELYSLNLETALTTHIPGHCVDAGDVAQFRYQPDASLLVADSSAQVVGEALYSHLLKTNCPVTGQPDWATVWVQYSGPRIDPASFLAYVVSFRQHQDFHENCVEKIFMDLQSRCQCVELTVYARYTRRGGLDINPFRTNTSLAVPRWRLLRQ